MGTIRYFAYGSNMLAQRLQRRCKTARVVGTAWVDGYELVFHKKSIDRSGKATIAKADKMRVYGVLFELDDNDRNNLDRAEGDGYSRIDDFVVQAGAGPIVVTTYIVSPEKKDSALLPYDWYLDLVIAGATHAPFPAAYLEWLRAHKSLPDPDSQRRSHIEALTLLRSLKEVK